ncbi:MAG: thiamine-monophosphate kinase [Cellvibrionaceae bacterium]|jgi:thiamine-monophosphate kinase
MSNSERLSEFEIIRRYFQQATQQTTNHPNVIKSIGDDCAILSVPSGYELLTSVDTLVVDRHFPASLRPEEVAQRAFCVCLSDLAAMGAQPAWFTLALTLPEADSEWLSAFSSALLAIANEYHCPLVGGDTTQGPLVITLQVSGLVKAGLALTRDGAEVGDYLYLTGPLGDGRAALSMLLESPSIESTSADYLRRRFVRPEPQIKAGLLLSGKSRAAIDISDGLLADLHHLAEASRVDIAIDLDAIPISSACRQVAGDQALNFALTGGDDYQLAFTLPEIDDGLLALMNRADIDACAIGRVLPCNGHTSEVYGLENGRRISWDTPKGYQHFTR